jgi:hypothetical protein
MPGRVIHQLLGKKEQQRAAKQMDEVVRLLRDSNRHVGRMSKLMEVMVKGMGHTLPK